MALTVCPGEGTHCVSPGSITDACPDLAPVTTTVTALMAISMWSMRAVPVSVTVVIIQSAVMTTVLAVVVMAAGIMVSVVVFVMMPVMMALVMTIMMTVVFLLRMAMASAVQGGRILCILCLPGLDIVV